MIRYERSLAELVPADLDGFFVGWPTDVSGERLLTILTRSDHVILARDDDAVVGFITAISDGVFSAFIPLLEVRPHHQGLGIGRRLLTDMLDIVSDMYSVDLVCDDNVVGFYERVGGQRLAGMGWRNRAALG